MVENVAGGEVRPFLGDFLGQTIDEDPSNPKPTVGFHGMGLGSLVDDLLSAAVGKLGEVAAEQLALAVAFPQDAVEEFFQDEVELTRGRLEGGGHTLQVLGQLIQRHRDPAGEPAGPRGVCGCERPIKMGLV